MALTKVSFDLLKDALHWVAAATNITVVNADGIMADTTAGAFTVTLPIAPNVGDRIGVKDAGSSFGTNNLTIDGNGNNVDGATTLVLSSNVSLIIQYNGVEWKSESALGGSGSGAQLGEVIVVDKFSLDGSKYINVETSDTILLRSSFPELSVITPAVESDVFPISTSSVILNQTSNYSSNGLSIVSVGADSQTASTATNLVISTSIDGGKTWTTTYTDPTTYGSPTSLYDGFGCVWDGSR